MEKFHVRPAVDPRERREFTQCVLRDLRALDQMIAEGLIETGVRRVGAEQELCIVDRAWSPSTRAMDVLAQLPDTSRYATELGCFNLEINLDPLPFGGDCLSRMEEMLRDTLARVRLAAAHCDSRIILTGILPTLRKADLDLDHMTPIQRYHTLNAALMDARGSEFELHIRGLDELNVKHDSVMLEACNTSCQFHFQIAPDEFARIYNIAQVAVGPVLAAACNSPLLFGRRLWRETRIAVFEQAIDTRSASQHIDEQSARVHFGNHWVEDSVLEIYEEDIARFRICMAADVDDDPLAALARGDVPRLGALSLHNGTVYRWNRPCYGVANGTPHLRIENRVLPAGPTIADEVANAAFWYGLVSGLVIEHADVRRAIEFDAARGNFLAAARAGLDARLTWFDGRRHPADELIRGTLLDVARRGLLESGIDLRDAERYLGIIEHRVTTRQTGAEWLIRSYESMQGKGTKFERLRSLVAAMAKREEEEHPVHEWTLAEIEEAGNWRHNYARVGQYMTTDLFTVHKDEVIDLVASVMAWRNIRHVPVEDDDHRLVGLVSSRSLLRYIAKELPQGTTRPIAVTQIMQPDPVTVTPDTPTREAIEKMQREGISCLPVVRNERLVGIVSEHDFMNIAAHLLKEPSEPDEGTSPP